MPLFPSLYASADRAQPWNLARAAGYGAGIGALAASFKAFGPLHASGTAAVHAVEIAIAASAFALLCAGAAGLRNFVARSLIGRE